MRDGEENRCVFSGSYHAGMMSDRVLFVVDLWMVQYRYRVISCGFGKIRHANVFWPKCRDL